MAHNLPEASTSDVQRIWLALTHKADYHRRQGHYDLAQEYYETRDLIVQPAFNQISYDLGYEMAQSDRAENVRPLLGDLDEPFQKGFKAGDRDRA